MTATKIQPGDDTHLTSLMAPHSLNFVTGADRAALLAYGRDVFAAGLAGVAPAAVAPQGVPVGVIRASSEIGVAPWADIWQWLDPGTKLYAGAAPAAVAPQGEYPPLPEGVMFIEQIGGDVIARPTEYAYFKNARGVVHGAQLFTADQLRAYFDLGRQPEAPALEAPAAPACDEEAAYKKWFQGEQGKPYHTMWDFARAAWMARAALAAAPQAPAVDLRPHLAWALKRISTSLGEGEHFAAAQQALDAAQQNTPE